MDMMKHGSVTAAFSVYSDFLTYSGGVYSFDSGAGVSRIRFLPFHALMTLCSSFLSCVL